ncbi:MAG: flagellar biosynthesis protein FlhB [Bacteroidetes bacterium]|nr:flagellar biosynthesis protein FlhB [Bacteroidota bacterium]MCH8524202.1 flagellar biosynthesis protein FlhB [Balneolales bacterium]
MSEKSDDAEKTEEPTARKIEKAREDGNVSISKEISSVILLSAALMTLAGFGASMYGYMEGLFEHFFNNAGAPIENIDHALEHLELAFWYGFRLILPLLILLVGVALLVNTAQTGFNFTFKALEVKGSKLNPIKGLGKIVSMRSIVELVKGLTKLAIVSLVIYYTVQNDVDNFLAFTVMPLGHTLSETGSYVLMFVTRILTALFLLALADAAYQRFQYHKDLRMTKQEVKDEFKQMEGDPHVKAKRKRFGMQLRQKKRLDHAVLASDVVVTNPTHYAVALKYDPEQNEAPIVMAKGQRKKALKIRELATKYGIPIVENKPVARALFATAEEDQYIPGDMFRAVAEILAYVYKLKQKKIS